MVLFSGILCLISASSLLYSIRKSQDTETSQILQKVVWLYWALLMVIAIHHISVALADSMLYEFLKNLSPITDALTALIGIILAIYLYHRSETRKANSNEDI